MMIRFESKTGSTVVMFEKDAEAILRMMDQSGVIPSAINAGDISTALTSLQQHLGAESSAGTKEDSSEEESVDMQTRAYPLIQLFQAAVEKHESVMWDYTHALF